MRFCTSKVLDSVSVTYGGGQAVKHGGTGGHKHATLFLSPQEDIVDVALRSRQIENKTFVKDIALVIQDRQTGVRRAWSARDKAIMLEVIYASWDVINVAGKVLKCFTGRSGVYVDQLSCVWHTPLIDCV